MSAPIPAKTWLTGSLCLAVGGLVIGQFVVPSKHERAGAVGSLEGLEAQAVRAFSDGGEFAAKKPPGAGDWLAQHKEAGQTFAQFVQSKPNKPDGHRGVIYLLPLGKFEEGKASSLATLREYTAAYYNPLRVWTLPALEEEKVRARSRVNGHTGKKQWNSEDLLRWMRGRLPKDAYAMIAVTMTDLYPQGSWNYVFGQASLKFRVGVFSFARYDPRFWDEPVDEGTATLMLKRSAKVLTHEIGHMFGMAHCIHYECNMNGSNNLAETDAAPMHLCPVCLRKMHHSIGFDPAARYEGLRSFYQTHGLQEEANWVGRRIRAIESAE